MNFDLERLGRRRDATGVRAAFAALAVGGIATNAVFGFLYVSGVVRYVTNVPLERVDVIRAVPAGSRPEHIAVVLGDGLAYGLQTGLALGVVGVATVPTERRSAEKAT